MPLDTDPPIPRIHSARRIPSLDGCRAISILLVLLSHLCYTRGFQSFDPYARMIFHLGPFGVEVFFVISGFLITTLLLNEEGKHGRVSIRAFYLRRAFRIWPVAYVYILVVALLGWTGRISLPPINLIYAATFTTNHFPDHSWFTGHLWSLAVEEQFYIVWPLVFLLTSKRGRLTACFLVLTLAPVLRILTYLHQPQVYGAMQESLLFTGDAIAVGCLLALLATELEDSLMVRGIIRWRWFFVVPLLSVVMYSTLKVAPGFYLGAGKSVGLVCIAATIWRVIHVRDAAFRLLNTKTLVAVGVLSYSLYIWQQLFLNPAYNSAVNRFPLNLLLVFGVATCSYYFVESPFLRLRPALSKWWASRKRDAGDRLYENGGMGDVRMDKWLWVARFFKTRALAAKACELGRVVSNGQQSKSSRQVRAGDLLEVKNEGGEFQVEVLLLSEVRGPASVAQTLYRETEASRAARLRLAEERKAMPYFDTQGTGKPSKRNRRELNRLRGRA